MGAPIFDGEAASGDGNAERDGPDGFGKETCGRCGDG